MPAGTPAASNPASVLVQNTGDAPLTITNVQVQGTDSADFQVLSQTCTAGPLAAAGGGIPSARGTCVVNVGFKPTRTNYTSVARLQFTSNSDSANEGILLVGKSNGDALSSVGGDVPSVMQLSVSPTASFGTFVPGVAATYNTALAANVTTTTANAALTMADLSTTAPGFLENGTFKLASPLQMRTVGLGQTPLPPFAPLNGTNSPATLWSWSTPVSNEGLTLDFRQSIGASEGLRAGTYSKNLLFTLSTTTP